MRGRRLNLASWLLLSAALPMWIFLAVPRSTGFGGSPTRFVIAPVVLAGITAAIHRLLRDRSNSLAIAALAAGVVALGSLLIISWLAR